LQQAAQMLKSDSAKKQLDAYRNLPKNSPDRKAAKMNLGYFVFTGCFDKRSTQSIKSYSQFLHFDLDHVSEDRTKLEAIKLQIFNTDGLSVVMAFVSPSEDGLKLVVQTDGITSPDTYKIAWAAWVEAFKKKLPYIADNCIIDATLIDISHPCFISYDKDLIITDMPKKPFKWSSTPRRKKNVSQGKEMPNKSIPDELARDYNRALLAVEDIEDSGIDITSDYNDWRDVGFALNQLGEYGRPLFHRVCRFYDRRDEGKRCYTPEECDHQFSKGKSEGINLETFFYIARKNGVTLRNSDGYVPMDSESSEESHAIDIDALLEKWKGTPFETILKRLNPIEGLYKKNKHGNGRVSKGDREVLVTRNLIEAANSYPDTGLEVFDGVIYYYTGKYWEMLSDEVINTFATTAAKLSGIKPLEAEHFQSKEELSKQLLASVNDGSKRAIEGLNGSEVSAPTFLNFQNGTLEIGADGKLKFREHRKEDGLRNIRPYDYNPDTKHPIFSKYLSEVLPNEQARNVLQEFFGNVLCPRLHFAPLDQRALVMYGTGANGKSVLCEVIAAVLGENYVTYSNVERLCDANCDEVLLIENKLLSFSTEGPKKFNSDRFKQLTRKEPISVEIKYKPSRMVTNYATITFNCNELPKNIERTEGYFRSFYFVGFNVTIPEEKRDIYLAQKIKDSELAGVANWLLEGLRRLIRNGRYSQYDEGELLQSRFRKESDSVALFLEDGGYIASLNEMSVKEVYSDYKDFCRDNGYIPCNRGNFLAGMKALGFDTGIAPAGRYRNQYVFHIVRPNHFEELDKFVPDSPKNKPTNDLDDFAETSLFS